MECGGGERYGFDTPTLHGMMLELGFRPYAYDPYERELVALNDYHWNTIYLRNPESANDRVRSRPWIFC